MIDIRRWHWWCSRNEVAFACPLFGFIVARRYYDIAADCFKRGWALMFLAQPAPRGWLFKRQRLFSMKRPTFPRFSKSLYLLPLFLFSVLIFPLRPIFSQDGIPWVPQVQLLDNNGDPLSAGHVHTYISGTTTNQATYTDSTLNTANANPVVLDAAGRANIWLDETLSYRMDVVAGSHAAGETALYSIDNITSQFSTTLNTIGTGAATDIRLHYDGNAQDFHIGLDDSEDDLVFGLGSVLGTTTAFAIDENQVTTFSQDPIIAGTTPQLTIGDAGAEDTFLVFDGAAQDFYFCLDDTADDAILGLGSACGTTGIVFLDENQDLGIGGASGGAKFDLTGNAIVDGAADEIQFTVQGNATQTSNVFVLEDSGGTDHLAVSGTGILTFSQDPVIGGTTPQLTVGDAGAEDSLIVFDGNAQDFYFCLDDTADDALLGLGSTCGTTGIIHLDANQDVGLGAASAGAKLDVTGNVLIDGNADEVQLTVQGHSTQTNLAFVVENSAGTDFFSVAGDGDMVVDTSTLFVDAGNNYVGIGDATPSTLLDMADTNSNLYRFALDSSSIFTGVASVTSTAGTFRIDTDDAADAAIIHLRSSARDWLFGLDNQTNDRIIIARETAAPFFTIDATGDLGLGTVSPGAMLDVVGDADAVQLQVKGHSTQTSDIARFRDTSNNDVLRVIHDPSANDGNVLLKASDTDHAALELDTQASPTAGLLHMKVNGTTASAFSLTATASTFILHARDFGNNVAGPQIRLNRNTSSGTEGPAAGAIRFAEADGTSQHVWIDATGDARVHTSAPTGSSGSPTVSDTAGTVIGTQTSPKAIKNIIYEWSDENAHFALQQVLDLPVYNFTFKDGRKGIFTGLAIEDGEVPWYGMDPAVGGDTVPHGTAKALNEINLFGYMVLSIRALEQRVAELERKLEER